MSVSNNQINFPEPIIYFKGKTPTKELVPTQKDLYGLGNSGKIHLHLNDTTKVVKKCEEDMRKEYAIGMELNHSAFVKTHQLYIKKNPNGKEKHKLVLEKIDGKTVYYYLRSEEKIPLDTVIKVLLQVEDCCRYLFTKQIGWADINDGNIFITKENNELKLIDFGRWNKISDPKKRTLQLLMGSMEIISWIVTSSTLVSQGSDDLSGNRFSFPVTFFKEQISLNQIYSDNIKEYKRCSWMQRLQKIIEEKPEKDRVNFISEYFMEVKKAILEPETLKKNV